MLAELINLMITAKKGMDCHLKNLHNSATMPALKTTPHDPVESIYADEFYKGKRYRVQRPEGGGDWLVILTVTGSGLLSCDDGQRVIHPGDLVVFSPTAAQDYRTNPETGEWGLVWAHFNPRPQWSTLLDFLPDAGHGVFALSLHPEEVASGAIAALRRAIQALRRTLPGKEDFALNALEEVFLWAAVARGKSGWTRTDPRVRKAMDYLGAQFTKPFEMAALAQHCGLSTSRMAHLFREETGTTPHKFSEALRMERARQLLLRTSATVGEIADLCGYDDAFYFTRRFTLAMGKSPRAMRTNHQGS